MALSDEQNVQRKEFIKRIIEKKRHVPSSGKEEQTVTCATSGINHKDVCVEQSGKEVTAFSSTPCAQKNGTADAVAKDLGMKTAPKTAIETVGENLGNGKFPGSSEELKKGDVIDANFTNKPVKSPEKKPTSLHVVDFASKGVSPQQQKANLQKLRAINNKRTAKNYNIKPNAKAQKENHALAQGITNTDSDSNMSSADNKNNLLDRLHKLVQELNMGSENLKKSDYDWSGQPEADKLAARKAPKPIATPKVTPEKHPKGIEISFDSPTTPPAPKVPALKKMEPSHVATPAKKKTNWKAQYQGKWYNVANVVDNKHQDPKQRVNMYHLEGVPQPVHAQHIEDLEIG